MEKINLSEFMEWLDLSTEIYALSRFVKKVNEKERSGRIRRLCDQKSPEILNRFYLRGGSAEYIDSGEI